MADERADLATGAFTDFSGQMGYGDYLRLPELLSLQQPLSNSHDEMLFIVIRQATELWMKLAIHELRGAIASISEDDLATSFKQMARVSRIQSQLIQSWDVLSTLTPSEYLQFRDKLGQASGFQSHQYRLIEFVLGNKQRARLKPHEHNAEVYQTLIRQLENPSIYDEAIRLLHRRSFSIPDELIDRAWDQPYKQNKAVLDAWTKVYENAPTHWDLYELAEKLIDIEDWFQQWRFRHMKTVERIIGHRRGTGGTAGVGYLKRALEIRFFPELWDLRTALRPLPT